MKKAFILLFLFIFISGFIVSCSGKSENPGNGPDKPVSGSSDEGIEGETLTAEAEITAWVENSSSMFLAQSRELEGKQYVLVTYGEKESNGYSVEITSTEVLEDRIQVYVTFDQPDTDEVVDLISTRPYHIVEMDATGLPVEFIASGAESFVPHLLGTEFLKPIVAGSSGIKIFAPAPDEKVGRQFIVEGIANVFEGNFQYKLRDSSGKVIVLGYNTAAMGDWKYFTISIDIDPKLQIEPELVLELFTESAMAGSIKEFVSVPLQLQSDSNRAVN